MGSQFNPQILVEKLSKLNSSQQSIETLSHWCIFHMNKAKQVVETWDRQFHCAPREQRLAFLYLANDILQNSRRKGAEFVAEFWKVLPGSLRDVIENGDDYGRNSAMRLISIWEERKVFGSRGQILKEEFGKRQLDNGNKNRKPVALKPQSPDGNALDKLVSGYEAICRSQTDEDAILTKCRNAISFVEKVDKNIQGDFRSGHADSTIGNELKEQNVILRDCIEQLAAVESARSNLVSLLREALQEQVYKLDQVRDQLQAAQSRTELVANICSQFVGGSDNGRILAESSEGNPVSQMPQKFVPGSGEQPNAVTYTRQISFPENSGHVEDNTKSAAAAMAAKLAASSSSAQMLTFVLSTLASEGVIGNQNQDPSSSEYPPSEKRAKIENEQPYIPQNSQAPPPTTSPSEPPPPPSSPPPLPPMPPPIQSYPVPQYMQTAMPILGGPYSYNTSQPPPPLQPPGYTPAGPPVAGVSAFAPSSNAYQSYPPEGGFYGQPSSLPMAPMNRQ